MLQATLDVPPWLLPHRTALHGPLFRDGYCAETDGEDRRAHASQAAALIESSAIALKAASLPRLIVQPLDRNAGFCSAQEAPGPA
jgi:hypothetical protein